MATLPQGEDLGYTDAYGTVWRLQNVGSHYTAQIIAPAYGWAGGAELVSAPSIDEVHDEIDGLVDSWKADPTKKAPKRALAAPVVVSAPKPQSSGGTFVVLLILLFLFEKKGR